MAKLHQVLAVLASKKAKASQVLTQAYHSIQKPPLFDGISRTYQPKDEDGEKLPPESKSIQIKVDGLIHDVTTALVDMFDVVATQDVANCSARADVIVDGKTLLKDVPVSHLLFLEKQLKDVETFVSKLPTLDPAETWTYNEASDQWATTPAETVRTKKVPKAFVAYDATKEHPAQVQVFNEDILAGYWRTVKFSGAIPAKDRNAMLERVSSLREAVLKAREEANGIDVTNVGYGKAVFNYIFPNGK